MTAQELKSMPKEDVLNFIRERLSFNNDISQHEKFDMSGYESRTGENTVSNMAVLNHFADLGIYDYTHYLFLDFYKGTPTLYLKYWNDTENIEIDDLSGDGTTEIIYRIFELTIFSDKGIRRRI